MHIENKLTPVSTAQFEIKPDDQYLFVKNRVEEYIHHFPERLAKGEGMIFLGEQETTKRILAISIEHALREAGYSVYQEINLRFLSELTEKSDRAIEDIYPYAEHAQLIIFNNFKERFFSLTKAEKDILNAILTIREYHKLPIIFLTGFNQVELTRYLSPKIVSDLFNPKNTYLEFNWEHDYALQEKS